MFFPPPDRRAHYKRVHWCVFSDTKCFAQHVCDIHSVNLACLIACPSCVLTKTRSAWQAAAATKNPSSQHNNLTGGADAAALSRALLSCASLARLQLQGCLLDARGCAALARLLGSTPTLAQLDITSSRFRGAAARGGPCAAGGGCGCGSGCGCFCCGRGERERVRACGGLAKGIRDNRTLRQVRV